MKPKSRAQPDLPLPVVEEGFDDTPSGQLAHIKSLLDREDWLGDPGGRDVPYRVYIALCALSCRRDTGRIIGELIPLVLALRDRIAMLDPDDDETAAMCAAVDEIIPRGT